MMTTLKGRNLSLHDDVVYDRNVHPMKGPLVTQTLRGMSGGAPFHWRGDRPTLQSFNPTFDKLMGGAKHQVVAQQVRLRVHQRHPIL